MFDLFGIKAARKQRALWAAIAGEFGGAYFEAKGFWKRDNERIEATIAGVPVVLDTYVVSTGKSQHSYTRVTAPFTHGPGPKTRVHRHGALAAIANVLGVDDHQLDDRQFDERFVVRSESAAVVRRLWNEWSRATMLAMFDDTKVRSDRTKIELIDDGVWDDADKLREGMKMIANLAGRDLYGVGILQRVPDGVFSQPAGQWPMVELDTGVRVVIRAEGAGDTLVMAARTVEPPAMAPCEIQIDHGRFVDPERGALLPQAAHVPMHAAGTGTLTIARDGMCFAWRDLEIDPACLRAGAELLGATAAARAAYR